MAINPALLNLAILLFSMQVAKKIPFDNPWVLNGLRFLYLTSNAFLGGLYYYVKLQIEKKKDKTVLKYVEPPPLGSNDPPKLVSITIFEYDMKQLKQLVRSQLMGIGMLGVMHLYFKYTNPLVVQLIMPIKTAIETNLVKVHVFQKPASGPLKRPWKAANGIMGMGATEVKTDRRSIEAAEQAAKQGAKQE